MSDTPIWREPPPKLDRVLAAHERRARLIAQLHAQAIATANDLSAQRKAIRADIAKDAGRRRAEAWVFSAGAFLLALGGIVTGGCVLAGSALMAAVTIRSLLRQSPGVDPDATARPRGLPPQGLAAHWCVFGVLVLRRTHSQCC